MSAPTFIRCIPAWSGFPYSLDRNIERSGLFNLRHIIYRAHVCLMTLLHKLALSFAHGTVWWRLRVNVWLCSALRPAKWCAVEWCATATTPTLTCSAAPSATPAWAASACTRTACSPTAAATHGWRTASSASAWWVRVDEISNDASCQNGIFLFSGWGCVKIQEKKNRSVPSVCRSAHTRNATNTPVSMEMLIKERCVLKRKSRRNILLEQSD